MKLHLIVLGLLVIGWVSARPMMTPPHPVEHPRKNNTVTDHQLERSIDSYNTSKQHGCKGCQLEIDEIRTNGESQPSEMSHNRASNNGAVSVDYRDYDQIDEADKQQGHNTQNVIKGQNGQVLKTFYTAEKPNNRNGASSEFQSSTPKYVFQIASINGKPQYISSSLQRPFGNPSLLQQPQPFINGNPNSPYNSHGVYNNGYPSTDGSQNVNPPSVYVLDNHKQQFANYISPQRPLHPSSGQGIFGGQVLSPLPTSSIGSVRPGTFVNIGNEVPLLGVSGSQSGSQGQKLDSYNSLYKPATLYSSSSLNLEDFNDRPLNSNRYLKDPTKGDQIRGTPFRDSTNSVASIPDVAANQNHGFGINFGQRQDQFARPQASSIGNFQYLSGGNSAQGKPYKYSLGSGGSASIDDHNSYDAFGNYVGSNQKVFDNGDYQFGSGSSPFGGRWVFTEPVDQGRLEVVV